MKNSIIKHDTIVYVFKKKKKKIIPNNSSINIEKVLEINIHRSNKHDEMCPWIMQRKV